MMLSSEFFNRSSIIVAKDLLGKYLVRHVNGKKTFWKIVETESYEGFFDKASHASRGQTVRNTPMFGKAGTIYVYFTYGMHHMLNIVCGKKGYPSAILIRGVEGCIGPGRLTKKLVIDKTLNGEPLGSRSGLWVENENAKGKLTLGGATTVQRGKNKMQRVKILKTPRIGVDYAGPVWSKKLYRFVLTSGKQL
jgi:DNA-3-methyladenine glycosylase